MVHTFKIWELMPSSLDGDCCLHFSRRYFKIFRVIFLHPLSASIPDRSALSARENEIDQNRFFFGTRWIPASTTFSICSLLNALFVACLGHPYSSIFNETFKESVRSTSILWSTSSPRDNVSVSAGPWALGSNLTPEKSYNCCNNLIKKSYILSFNHSFLLK